MRGFVFHPGKASLEIRLTRACIAEICTPGDNLNQCLIWVERLRPKLDKIPNDLIRDCLRPSGAWDTEELADDAWNRLRLLWIAAWNCHDERSCWTYLGT